MPGCTEVGERPRWQEKYNRIAIAAHGPHNSWPKPRTSGRQPRRGGSTMTAADAAAGAMGAVPRDYNFAADVLARNLAAGRADKAAYIDGHRTLTYRQLADRVARFATALRGLGLRREERVLIALTDTIDWPTAFLGCLK